MLNWEQRPVELANLLNPCFSSLIMHIAIKSYESEKGSAMPYELAFLVFPVVLHRDTRDKLPTMRLKLHSWIHQNPELRLGFAERTRRLVPYAKEAITFGSHHRLIGAGAEGLTAVKRRISIERVWPKESEPFVIAKKAEFMGRWLAANGESQHIFKSLGISP